MADEKLVTPAERVQEQQRLAAREATATPRAKPADETVPGGRYKVGESLVDAEGKPLGKKD
jgi:hypothetical protein